MGKRGERASVQILPKDSKSHRIDRKIGQDLGLNRLPPDKERSITRDTENTRYYTDDEGILHMQVRKQGGSWEDAADIEW